MRNPDNYLFLEVMGHPDIRRYVPDLIKAIRARDAATVSNLLWNKMIPLVNEKIDPPMDTSSVDDLIKFLDLHHKDILIQYAFITRYEKTDQS